MRVAVRQTGDDDRSSLNLQTLKDELPHQSGRLNTSGLGE